MLDQQDIVILKNMMESVMDEKLVILEASMMTKVDEKLTRTENLILEELERTRTILEDKIQKVQDQVDELNQYYSIIRLENDNTVLFLKRVDELENRVDKLEEEQYKREENSHNTSHLMAAEG